MSWIEELTRKYSCFNRSSRPIEAWLERAVDVRGKMLPCGHYPAEQVPDETYAELRTFFASSD